ncbi:SPARC protein [Armadillidium vulgare]|nr:SPARC protein [Armadillidium vulgare]
MSALDLINDLIFLIFDPCKEIFCGAGRECMISEKGEGLCRCVERCENIDDDRRKVCSNHNETWPSDCELYRMRCICSEGGEECRSDKYEHVHIDYYGTCQDVPECEEEEMSDFPRRMREWLFNIMKDLASRKELSDEFMKIEKKVEEEPDTKKWANAAVWKWCELDGYPKDRAVSRHELFPLRAPLYTLEHCIAPFLDSCDPDDDHYITLKEWSQCLELTDDLTEDMEDFCEKIRE